MVFPVSAALKQDSIVGIDYEDRECAMELCVAVCIDFPRRSDWFIAGVDKDYSVFTHPSSANDCVVRARIEHSEQRRLLPHIAGCILVARRAKSRYFI